MLRTPFLMVVLGATIGTCQAQEARLHAGEIALNGTVSSLDVVKNTLTINATSFAVSGGSSKALPQAKTKLIQIAPVTQFVETSGIKNTSLGDLGKGLKVTVVGQELGARKPFVARLVRWSAPDPALIPDPDTPAGLATLLPPAQKAGDISIRVFDAGFAPLNRLFQYPGAEKRPNYFFSYRLTGPEVSGNNDAGYHKTLNDLVVLKHIYGPDGQVILPTGSGPLDMDTTGHGQRFILGTVNPSWKNITADYEVLAPDAPPSARGVFVSELTFQHVPVPGAIGKSIPLSQVLTTANGTKIVLDKVEGMQAGPRGATNFHLNWTPPDSAPDLRMTLEVQSVKSGTTAWNRSSWGGGTNGNALDARLDDLGPAGAQEMDVTFKITEKAPSLQDRKWFKRVQITVPVASLVARMAPPAPGTENPVLAQVSADGFTVQAEQKEKNGGNGWNGRLWFKSEGLPADEQWLEREAVGTDENGQKMNTWVNSVGSDNQFWHVDGSRSGAGEYSQPVSVNGDHRPAKVNLALKMEKARRVEHWSHLTGIPVPPPGQAIEVRTGQVEDDYLAVKRVINFQSAAALPGAKSGQGITKGLAVVVEIEPLIPTADLEFRVFSATDDMGRDLGDGNLWSLNGDLTRAGTENTHFRTILLPVLPAGIKTLDMRFLSVETAWSGQTQQINLKDIAVK